MTFAIEWTNVHLAGAFLIGWVFGTVVTLRLMRVLADVFRQELRLHRPKTDDD